MGSFVRKAVGVGTAVFAVAALTTPSSVAQAEAKRRAPVVCGGSISAAITAAGVVPTTLTLAANCTYDIATQLVIGAGLNVTDYRGPDDGDPA